MMPSAVGMHSATHPWVTHGGGGGLHATIGGLFILRWRPSPNPGDGGRWGPDFGCGAGHFSWQAAKRKSPEPGSGGVDGICAG